MSGGFNDRVEREFVLTMRREKGENGLDKSQSALGDFFLVSWIK
jgi:hypothetical protein